MSTPAAADATLPHGPGQILHGFEIRRTTVLPELRCHVVEARHLQCGARLLHLVAQDAENLFAVAFRTPPRDNTGLPHILEHSVLNGSQRFPVKDPFVEMLKTSMATFINAMTYPDRTVYPVASNVRQDYFNLVEVYLDAVLHPDLSENTLKQEGHHLAFRTPGDLDSALTIRGIVYNEMRGAYSDPDNLIARVSTQNLFPDSAYGLDSGGDPAAIPALDYAAFTAYYRAFYHPANSYICLYGDIPTETQLAFLNERLSAIEPAPPVDSRLQPQPCWDVPRTVEELVPVDAGVPPQTGTAVTLNWLLGVTDEPIMDLTWEVLDRLLLGSAAAPLRKALVDSRLGEDLTSSGYGSGSLEGTFHVGLKGIDIERWSAVSDLITQTLERVAESGFTPAQLESAFHGLHYAVREIRQSYPLQLMQQVYSAWIFDRDPLLYLSPGEALKALQHRAEADPELFRRLIQTALLDNRHRLTAVFRPDPELAARRDRELAAELQARKEKLARAELEAIDREAAALLALQAQTNSAAALAALPQLHVEDLPAAPKTIPSRTLTATDRVTLIDNDVFANGVNYLLLAFDLSGLPADLWELVPVLAAVLPQLGAADLSYVEMAEQLTSCTGGIEANTFLGTDARDPSRTLRFFTLSCKALDDSFGRALDLVWKLFSELDLSNSERLVDVFRQRRAQIRSGIIRNGHRFAALEAARNLSPTAALQRLWSGTPQVRLSHTLAEACQTDPDSVRAKLEAVRGFLLNGTRTAVSFTGSDAVRPQLEQWLTRLPRPAGPAAATPNPGPGRDSAPGEPVNKGLVLASDVAFCARCLPAPHGSHPDAPLLAVFSRLLAYDYLWEEIRAKGGAYGGFSVYDSGTEILELLSYRDPAVERTLHVYDRVRDYAARAAWSGREIERAIIGCAKADEKPIRPGFATATALWRHLSRLDEELRQARRAALLQAAPATVRAAALRLLDAGLEPGNVCVLAGRASLEEANRNLESPLELEDVLPVAAPA